MFFMQLDEFHMRMTMSKNIHFPKPRQAGQERPRDGFQWREKDIVDDPGHEYCCDQA